MLPKSQVVRAQVPRKRPVPGRSLVRRIGCLAAVLALSGLTTSPARASGISVARFGAELGHPTTENPTALFYNPAGIALNDGTRLMLDGTVAWRRVKYWHPPAANDVPEPEGAEGANNGEANLFNILVSPFLGASTKLGPVALGLAAYVPYGGQSEFDKNEDFEESDFPGAVDGVARWYSIEGEIRSIFLTAGAAYTFGDSGLSVGLTGNLIYSNVHTIRARTAVSDNSIDDEGRSLIDVSSWDLSFGLGVIYEAIEDRLWLGASYQSRPNLDGDMVLSGTLTNHFARQTVSTTDVDLHQTFPDVVRAGVRYRPERDIELRLFGDWTRWSALERQCIVRAGEPCEVDGETGAPSGSVVPILNQERDWHDTFGVRAGTSIWITPRIEFMSGLGYSSNAVPDETQEPALPDWNGVSAALGARFELVPGVYAAGTYTQLFYFPRDTRGESEISELSPPSQGPDSGGVYQHAVGALNANVDVVF